MVRCDDGNASAATHEVLNQQLDEWVAGQCNNAALVILVARHLDVAFFAPVRAPAETVQYNSDICLIILPIKKQQSSYYQQLNTVFHEFPAENG